MELHKFLNSPESVQNAYLYNKKAPRGSRYVHKKRVSQKDTFIIAASLISIIAFITVLFTVTFPAV